MNDDSGGTRKEGHGSAAGFVGLTALVALVAVGLLWSVSSRQSNGQAVASLNKMFAEIQKSADAAAAASSPTYLSLDTASSACVINKSGSSVRFHIVVRNDATLESITTARPVVRLENGDAISRGQDDQLLQIPAGMTRTVDVLVPYGEQEPALCAVTLSDGAGGTVPMRGPGSTA